MQRKAGILLVGRHAALMDSLADRVRTDSRLAVLGVVCTPKESAEAVSERPVDLVLIDIDASGKSHFDAACAIKAIRPEVHIVFLDGVPEDAVIEQAFAVGARGLVLKHDPPGAMLTAIHEVLDGGCCFPQEIHSRLVVDARGVSLAPQGSRTRFGSIAVGGNKRGNKRGHH